MAGRRSSRARQEKAALEAATKAARKAAKKAAKTEAALPILPPLTLPPLPLTLTSLDQADRRGLVNQSGVPAVSNHSYVTAHQLELTALGANLDLDGHWAPPTRSPNPRAPAPSGNLAAWRQITTSGRDQYVQVVKRGYLYPLGLEACLIEVTEREFVPAPENQSVSEGYLGLKRYIKVTQPTKRYPAFGQPFGGRTWPFPTVTAVTVQTPPVDPIVVDLLTGKTGTPDTVQFFVPSVAQVPFEWTLHAVDVAGHAVTLTLPLVFMQAPNSALTVSQFDPAAMSIVAAKYNHLDAAKRTSAVGGVSLQYAPEDKKVPGGTSHPTTSITLAAASPLFDPSTHTPASNPPSTATLTAQNQPACYPVLGNAKVRLHAVETLSRQTLGSGSGDPADGVGFSYFSGYAEKGFQTAGANLGQVYAAIPDVPAMSFPTDSVGGLANPAAALTGLSASAGALGGELSSYADTAKAQVGEYFDSAKNQALDSLTSMLGGLPLVGDGGILSDFVKNANDEADQVGPQVKHLYDEATAKRQVSYGLSASTKVAKIGGSPLFEPTDGDSTVVEKGLLSLTTVIVVDPTGTSSVTSTGTITPFRITLLPGTLAFIQIPFNAVSFTAQTGQKTDVDMQIGDVAFIGEFSFINAIEQLLSSLGGDGLSIDVTPTQVSAALDLALPSLGFGVFTLANLGLSADLTIPFLSGPTVAHFALASAERPFTLTVCMFGGGGYLALGMGMADVQSVTVSLDFEGCFGLDVVVASGSVSIMAGLTYAYDVKTGTKLTGFVNIHGEVEVLGIVSITLELDINMSYVSANDGTSYVEGTATMQASIDVAFFSASVPITVTKQFGNSGGSSGAAAPAAGAMNARAAAPLAVAAPAARSAAASASVVGAAAVTTFQDVMATVDDWATYCAAFG